MKDKVDRKSHAYKDQKPMEPETGRKIWETASKRKGLHRPSFFQEHSQVHEFLPSSFTRSEKNPLAISSGDGKRDHHDISGLLPRCLQQPRLGQPKAGKSNSGSTVGVGKHTA